MNYDRKNSWALVTGASGGMGADFARQLAFRGYNLILTARREDELLRLKAEISAVRGDIQIVIDAGDLSLREFRDRLIASCAHLDVEVLINNAGIGAYGAFDEIPAAREDSMLDLDIKALVHLTRAFSSRMKAQGAGFILQTASIAAFQPCPLFSTYAAAKSFVLSYGLAVRTELRNTGVSVTVLCPGVTATSFFEVAEQKKLSAFQKMSMMSSGSVVKGAVTSLFAKKAVWTPGFINKANAVLVRFLPMSLTARIAKNLA